jgi:Xaa-Pro dipeptidase
VPERSGVLKLEISSQEYKRRTGIVLDKMKELGLDAFVFWNNTSVFYLCGFSFIPTERPACMILTKDGKKTMYVPRLEVEHATQNTEVSETVNYPEYPGDVHPLKNLAGVIAGMGLANSNIGSDAPGYSLTKGYRGPSLLEVLPTVKLTLLPYLVEEIRVIKSPEEIAFIKESARWGNLAHSLLQKYSLPGFLENEVAMKATIETTRVMVATLGDAYNPKVSTGLDPHVGFRGQIGPNSALPHAIDINAVLKPGDNLVTYACPTIGGYTSELERTMFVGEPNAEQRKYFGFMKEIQETAFGKIRPGRPCSDVDKAVREVYAKHNLWDYWRHHTGHALGLLNHELPFFDAADHTIMRPGMVFSVEPGVFVPGLGGFRHSDTVLITETGMEMITWYPRDLDRLICG